MIAFTAQFFSRKMAPHQLTIPGARIMSVQNSIEFKLQEAFSPVYLEVENESHRHSGPATDSHFKVTVVSAQFDGVPLVRRHRSIYELLRDELTAGVHALALHTYTPDEWRSRQGSAPASPDCRGGSKKGV